MYRVKTYPPVWKIYKNEGPSCKGWPFCKIFLTLNHYLQAEGIEMFEEELRSLIMNIDGETWISSCEFILVVIQFATIET